MRTLKIGDERKSLKQWSEISGTPEYIIEWRMDHRWDAQECVWGKGRKKRKSKKANDPVTVVWLYKESLSCEWRTTKMDRSEFAEFAKTHRNAEIIDGSTKI